MHQMADRTKLNSPRISQVQPKTQRPNNKFVASLDSLAPTAQVYASFDNAHEYTLIICGQPTPGLQYYRMNSQFDNLSREELVEKLSTIQNAVSSCIN